MVVDDLPGWNRQIGSWRLGAANTMRCEPSTIDFHHKSSPRHWFQSPVDPSSISSKCWFASSLWEGWRSGLPWAGFQKPRSAPSKRDETFNSCQEFVENNWPVIVQWLCFVLPVMNEFHNKVSLLFARVFFRIATHQPVPPTNQQVILHVGVNVMLWVRHSNDHEW